MTKEHMPETFRQLQATGAVTSSDLLRTPDGFWLMYKSLSNILAENNTLEVPDADGERLPGSRV